MKSKIITYEEAVEHNGYEQNNGCLIDIKGKKIGRLTVLKVGKRGPKNENCWVCMCDCGNYVLVQKKYLILNESLSCGCFQKECVRKAGRARSFNSTLASKNHLWLNHNRQAKKRNILLSISREEFDKTTYLPCFYCKKSNTSFMKSKYRDTLYYTGIDRIDNEKGYETGNIVPCCRICNAMKCKMSISEFFEHLEKISVNFSTGSVCGRSSPPKENPYFISLVNIIKSRYKIRSRERKIEFLLSTDQFIDIIFRPCFYCGTTDSNVQKHPNSHYIKYMGIDRQDNNNGYVPGNVVPCCKVCNRMKTVQSTEDFINRVHLVLNNIRNEKWFLHTTTTGTVDTGSREP